MIVLIAPVQTEHTSQLVQHPFTQAVAHVVLLMPGETLALIKLVQLILNPLRDTHAQIFPTASPGFVDRASHFIVVQQKLFPQIFDYAAGIALFIEENIGEVVSKIPGGKSYDKFDPISAVPLAAVVHALMCHAQNRPSAVK